MFLLAPSSKPVGKSKLCMESDASAWFIPYQVIGDDV
jgi:hypothetical protein